MRKNYVLKYLTIALIIAAVVRLIFGFMMINFYSLLITFEETTPEIVRIVIWAIVFVMLNMLTQLICAFVGAVNWEEPDRALPCFIWGVIALATGVVANVLQILCGYGASVYVWIIGAGIPAVYTVAALVFLIFRPRRKKS